MNQKKIGSFIKELRQSHSLTQEELAQILGVNHRTVSRWETGKNMPDYDVIIDMAKYFQVNVDEILNGERQVTQQKSRFLKNKYAIMNNMNYHVVNFVFNIVSILMIIFAYNQGWYGQVTEDLLYILLEFGKTIFFDPVDIFFVIVILLLLIKHIKTHFQSMQETIAINLIIYNMIFIPIIIALSGFIYFLVFYVYESAWLIAFVNIFLNTFLFHWLYVTRFHNEVDRIWTYQKKS